MEIKVFVVGTATHYARWIKDCELVSKLEDANIVLFTGGEDVDPTLYGCTKHPSTYSNIDRDLREKEIFNSIKPNQLALGICRGSQFLCVMNGGLLIQHCEGHAIGHTHELAIIFDRKEILSDITSTHHQMQYPFNLDEDEYQIIGRTRSRLSPTYEGSKIREVPVEPEIVLYRVPGKPVSLAIQGHPEMMRPEAPVIEILNKIVTKCLAEFL